MLTFVQKGFPNRPAKYLGEGTTGLLSGGGLTLLDGILRLKNI